MQPVEQNKTVVPTYICPSETSSPTGQGSTTNGRADLWIIGNYSYNYFIFGNPTASSTAAREQGSSRSDPKERAA